MKPEVLIFDCANTLVRVDWDPAQLAVDCCSELNLNIDEQQAKSAYRHLLGSRWGHFQELNRQRSQAVCDRFWWELTRDWVASLGLQTEVVDPLIEAANRRLFGPDSTVFSLFPDTVPALELLKSAGHRMAVVSNWDISLHRTLDMLGLDQYFEVVIASLEEGVEKPDPRLFAIALNHLGAESGQAAHVGDNPIDDLQGARDAGIRGILLDREQETLHPWRIQSLTDLPSVL